MKGYRISQTIELLEGTMAKVEAGDKYVDKFVDLLRFYFVLKNYQPKSDFTVGVIISWNELTDKDDFDRSDFTITDVCLPEVSEN